MLVFVVIFVPQYVSVQCSSALPIFISVFSHIQVASPTLQLYLVILNLSPYFVYFLYFERISKWGIYLDFYFNCT